MKDGAASHLDERGNARMVDVSEKTPGPRMAVAEGRIHLGKGAAGVYSGGPSPKGDIRAAARIAAILAVKRVPGLIPLCHTVSIDSVSVDLRLDGEDVVCTCRVSGVERTGFEMEALTGVSVALLTIYDMLKHAGKGMEIRSVRLVEKTGGKSGDYRWEQ